jgi:hypothetical protein
MKTRLFFENDMARLIGNRSKRPFVLRDDMFADDSDDTWSRSHSRLWSTPIFPDQLPAFTRPNYSRAFVSLLNWSNNTLSADPSLRSPYTYSRSEGEPR